MILQHTFLVELQAGVGGDGTLSLRRDAPTVAARTRFVEVNNGRLQHDSEEVHDAR